MNRFQRKVFAIQFDSVISHADIATDIMKQDIVQGHFGAGLGQSGIDDQRAVGSGVQTEEPVGDDRG